MNNYIDVVIFKNVINLDKLYTYENNINANVGEFIIVDFNNSLEIALVLDKYSSGDNFDVKKASLIIKELTPLNQTFIELGLWMKEFYILTFAKSFSTICDLTRIRNISYSYKKLKDLNSNEESLINEFNNEMTLSAKDNKILNDLVDQNKISKDIFYDVVNVEKTKYYSFLTTLDDTLEKVRSNAIRQIELINEIYDNFYEIGYFSSEDLYELINYKKNVFDDLLSKNIFEEILKSSLKNNSSKKFTLTENQNLIVKDILKSNDNKFLIHGVTGSGKTEIYFEIIEQILKKDQTAIFLVPEIGLTPQMEMRTRKRFGNLVSIIHSKLTRSKRIKELDKLKNNESKILLGTRSAIFTQIKNIGLIIIDEEHDNSYKLDSHNKYDVREVARFLVEKNPSSKMILGSATPSVETYFKAKNNIYKLYTLKERPNSSKLPEIVITDMRKELDYGNTTPFSVDLLASVKNSLNKSNQSILFLNRRGYSNFVTCRTCGHTIKCDKCDVSMVYHKNKNFLKCHYCGDTKSNPRLCPNCGSKNIKQFGMGTEQLEELTKINFPDSEILRIDSDTTYRREDYLENVKKILNKEVSVIVGTQMITKGFDFPGIDTVGVIAADLSLNIPEYDATEKTFQILMQVAGRSGRSKDKGKVIIQTYNPDHYSIRHVIDHDYESFYEEELILRKAFNYPPFRRQYTITVLDKDLNKGLDIASKLIDYIREEINNSGLNDYAEIISDKERLSYSRINNRYHIRLYLNSTIRHESQVKKLLGNILIKNVNKINLVGTHIDVVTR